MKKPKVIIYDNDGMIIHGGRFSDQYSKEFGVDLTTMMPFFDGPFKKCLTGKADLREELAQVVEIWKWKGTVDELMQYWFAVGNVLYEDVYASIAKLKKQGLVVCVATNQEKYRNQYLVRKYSYSKVFDEIFCSASLGVYKHSLEGLEKIYQRIKEKYNIFEKGEIMYWDDRDENIQNSNKAGFNGQQYKDYQSFRAVLLNYGYQV
ncbi:HAD hydrolase-like protein [Patescibacteria group bacterium]|nr:HAD hydrolase-like protein [Patescibacteria group bacterium]